MKHPRVIVAGTAADAAANAAALLDEWIDEDRGAATGTHIALAGGSTPAATYRILATRRSNWDGVQLWFGDERLVPADHADANVAMVRRELVEPAGMTHDQVHVPDTSLDVTAAAEAYGARITQAVPVGPHHLPRFSIVILGVGEDAHFASLFPNASTLAATTVCVGVSDAPKPPPHRISLTLPVINAAARRMVIVTGAAKAPALQAALGPANPASPASMLVALDTTVIADLDAAASLS